MEYELFLQGIPIKNRFGDYEANFSRVAIILAASSEAAWKIAKFDKRIIKLGNFPVIERIA